MRRDALLFYMHAYVKIEDYYILCKVVDRLIKVYQLLRDNGKIFN